MSQQIPTVSDFDAGADVPGHLRVEELSHDLKRRSARGGALMVSSHAIQLLIGVGGTAVLARLLRPQDFGYLTMVATLTAFVATFRDLGLPSAAVHKQQLTQEQASGLFWINCLASLGVAALVAGMAPVLAWFYGEPKLLAITLVMSLGILASSLGTLHAGLLRRQMQFGAITVIEIGAMVAGVAVGISAALAGTGYWALVWQQMTIWVWQSAWAWLLCGWRPARRAASAAPSDPGLRSMLRYGRNVTAARLAEYVGRNMDAVLVGRFAGPASLGLYQKAYQWAMTPFWQLNTPMLTVAVSSFSRLQNDHGRYRLYVRITLLGVFALTLPAMALLFVEADGVIRLLLGAQWVAAIPMLRILSVGAYFSAFVLVTKWLYLSEGRTGEQLRWALASAPITIAGVAAGVRWGAVGVAYGFTASTIILAAPGVWYCLRNSPLRLADFWSAAWRPIVASLLSAAVLWPLRSLLPAMPHLLVRFVLDSAIYLLLYAACWMGLPGGRGEMREVLKHLRPAPRG